MKNGEEITICDGELVIVKITEDLYDEAIELYQNYFMKYENVNIATNALDTQESIDEMEKVIRAIMTDGVSFAAKHSITNELVAMCINKIVNPAAGCTLEPVLESCKTPSLQCMATYVERLEGAYDLFTQWHIDCVMEIVFLSTRPDFGKKGIALIMSELAIDYARKMMNGTLEDYELLPDHVKNMKPQAVCSIFTSNYTQRIGEKLGFETLIKISNKEFEFEGKTFAEKIDAVHEYSTFAAIRL